MATVKKPSTAITPNPKKKTTVAFAINNAIKKVAKYIFPKITVFPSKDIKQCYPTIQNMYSRLEANCLKLGIRIKPTNTFRSYAYQASLHKKMPNGAATPGFSMHEFHCAFDVCINDKKRAFDPQLLSIVGREWEKLGGTWGGRFSSIDMPHCQYTFKLTEAQIRAGVIPE